MAIWGDAPITVAMLPISAPFVWKRDGEMVDLNTLVRNQTDLHLDGVSFINNRGQIAGGAVTPTGEGRSVLLIPVSD